MPKLTPEEVEAFLTEPAHLMRLGTVDADGAPRVVPIWFVHEDGNLFFTARERSVWGENLRREPRLAASIDEEPVPYRKVTVQGRAQIAYELGDDDEWRDLYRRIGARYFPEEAANEYVDDTIDQPRTLFSVALDDPQTQVSSWRMPLEGEDVSGIWAQRYYRQGTKMAEHIASGERRPMYGS